MGNCLRSKRGHFFCSGMNRHNTFNQSLNHSLKQKKMDELISKLKSEVGLTDEQAKKAIEAIKTYVVEKFPMLEGAVSNLFGS